MDLLLPLHDICKEMPLGNNQTEDQMKTANILYWRGFTTWFMKFDAERAFHLFFNSFEVCAGCVVSHLRNGSISKKWSFVLIPSFCALLREQLPLQIKEKHYALLKNRRFPSWNGIIEKMNMEIEPFCTITEIHVPYKSCNEARLALMERTSPSLKRAFLRGEE